MNCAFTPGRPVIAVKHGVRNGFVSTSDRTRKGTRIGMATTKQVRAAKSTVKKAQRAASSKKTIADMPAKTKTALGKQGAAVAQRKRTGASAPKTRAELYEMAKRRDLPGRSKMGRDELAKKLGVR
jgi:hypothetical protein